MSARHALTFDCRTRRIDDATVLAAPVGPLDLQSAPPLKRTLSQLTAEGCRHLILDFSRVTFLDSTALAVLVGVKRRLGADGTLAVAAADHQARRVFELTGLDRTLRLFTTVEAALESVTDSAGRQTAPTDLARRLPLTRDAAVVLGIAATAMPFADSSADRVERWLRALRLHGQAGVALASLGFTEDAARPEPAAGPGRAQPDDRGAAEPITERADQIATALGASSTGTAHLLLAVIDCYGPECEQVLSWHGVDRDDLRALLEAEPVDASA